MSDLTRANRVTAYWKGEGIAVGVFYKTHDKIMELLSNDQLVVNAGFTMPEGSEEAPITAQDKLASFKNFLQTNASSFGIQYDPVDRRDDEFKFPNKYDEETFKEYSRKMVVKSVSETLDKVQKNVIANLVKSGNLPEGSEVNYGIGDEPEITIKESYNNGNIKYAIAKYPVALQVGEQIVNTYCTAEVVSGQLKKPRELEDAVLTQTGIKSLLIENGLIPKIEKPAKEDAEENDAEPQSDDAEAE